MTPGNGERLSFIYDSSRISPSGLVGEVVVPPVAGKPSEQFARTPYAAGFQRGAAEFILTTVHIIWGDNAASRVPEMTGFAKWMRAWADRRGDWNENLLVLGDFNLDRTDDPLYRAFLSTGLWPPGELNGIPRTIFDDPTKPHFYDQIAWFSDVNKNQMTQLLTSLTYTGKGGFFDFLPHCFPSLTKTEVSWCISDHYPLWVEFNVTP